MEEKERNPHMSYDSLVQLRKFHPAWRLLAAQNAPLILSFLYQEFVLEHRRELAESTLVLHLTEHLDQNPEFQERSRSPQEYLVSWAAEDSGWLRRYYPIGQDEVHYDLTPGAQKAVEWLLSLQSRNFIGTESRLMLVFDLLRQIIAQSQTNPQLRIQELEREKAQIEEAIRQAKEGTLSTLDSVQVKERFLQAMDLSHELLADFRAVEQNFRGLGRELREKISTWDQGKGALVGDYFSSQNQIQQSEQGRSFMAFFDFLMSASAQEEFQQMQRQLVTLDALEDLASRQHLSTLHNEWLSGSRHVWRAVEAISEQLRRYVDENYIQEERQLSRLIRHMKGEILSLKGDVPKGGFMEIDEVSPALAIPFDRNLFPPRNPATLSDDEIPMGQGVQSDDALYTQSFVDRQKLRHQIDGLLQERDQVSLGALLARYPLEDGLTELLTYLSLEDRPYITGQDYEALPWVNTQGQEVQALMHTITYYKEREESFDGTAD